MFFKSAVDFADQDLDYTLISLDKQVSADSHTLKKILDMNWVITFFRTANSKANIRHPFEYLFCTKYCYARCTSHARRRQTTSAADETDVDDTAV